MLLIRNIMLYFHNKIFLMLNLMYLLTNLEIFINVILNLFLQNLN